MVCEAETPSIFQGLWGEAISTAKEEERLLALNSAGMGWVRSTSKESVRQVLKLTPLQSKEVALLSNT